MDRKASSPAASGAFARTLVPAIPYLWLAIFFLVPFAIVFKIALSDATIAQPPYKPVIDWAQGLGGVWEAIGQLDFENFALLTDDPLYWQAALSSLRIAAISTAILLVLGYPMAYAMAKAPEKMRPLSMLRTLMTSPGTPGSSVTAVAVMTRPPSE